MHKIGSVISLVCCLLLFSCKHAPPPPPSSVIPVNLLTVSAQPVVYYEKFPATTVALKQVDLLPEVQGYITGLFFKEGSHVMKGQRLYEIDRRTYQGNYNTAVANLKVAQGNEEQAKQDADRYTYLNNNRAVAKQLYDHAVIAYKNAQNATQAAAESVKNAHVNLNFSEIVAPFSGTIGFSQVKLGNLVSVGQTVLNTISTDDPMGVDFLINEKQLAWFRNLQQDTHKHIDSLFTLLLPNNALYSGLGKIYVMDRAVNAQTGALRVRLTFPNPGYSLRPGMSCVVRVHNQDAAPQLVIPYKAIAEQMGEYFVYVARDTSMPVGGRQDKKEAPTVKQGQFALQKKVKLGEVIEPNVVVKSGIREGDKIVVDGVQSLHDGAQITTENKRPPEQGKAR